MSAQGVAVCIGITWVSYVMHEVSFHRKDKINGVIFFHRHKFHEAMSITSLRIEFTESHAQHLQRMKQRK